MEQEHNAAPNGKEEASVPNTQVVKKKILLVDDHPIFRHGLTELLDRQVDLVVCGHADSAPGALEQMRRLKPDLAILDITLRGTNGIELVKLMKAESPQLPILVL